MFDAQCPFKSWIIYLCIKFCSLGFMLMFADCCSSKIFSFDRLLSRAQFVSPKWICFFFFFGDCVIHIYLHFECLNGSERIECLWIVLLRFVVRWWFEIQRKTNNTLITVFLFTVRVRIQYVVDCVQNNLFNRQKCGKMRCKSERKVVE